MMSRQQRSTITTIRTMIPTAMLPALAASVVVVVAIVVLHEDVSVIPPSTVDNVSSMINHLLTVLKCLTFSLL